MEQKGKKSIKSFFAAAATVIFLLVPMSAFADSTDEYTSETALSRSEQSYDQNRLLPKEARIEETSKTMPETETAAQSEKEEKLPDTGVNKIELATYAAMLAAGIGLFARARKSDKEETDSQAK